MTGIIDAVLKIPEPAKPFLVNINHDAQTAVSQQMKWMPRGIMTQS